MASPPLHMPPFVVAYQAERLAFVQRLLMPALKALPVEAVDVVLSVAVATAPRA